MHIFNKKFLYTLLGFIGIIATSFFAYLYPTLNEIMFWTITILTFIISLKNLHLGFYIAFSELLIGSQGYLFFTEIQGLWISVRLGIFIAIIAAYTFKSIKERKIHFFKYKQNKIYYLFAVVILYGIINAIIRNHSLKEIFLDANGYIYFVYIIIIAYIVSKNSKYPKILSHFYYIITAGITTITLHSLFLLYTFSHTIRPWLRPLYLWTRDHRIGEIAQPYTDSAYHRIFFQNHIYLVFGFIVFTILFLLHKKHNKNKKIFWSEFILSVLSFTITLISFSRSFWVGTVVALGILCIYIIYVTRKNFKEYLTIFFKGTSIIIVSVIIIIGTMNFPFPKNKYIAGSDIFKNRLNFTTEPAVSSRWNLLPEMLNYIKQAPIFGYGFAKNITYQVEDPRIKNDNNPDGWYTTYSFEWGYLTFILQFGLLGFVLLLYTIYLYIKHIIKTLNQELNHKNFHLCIYLTLITLAIIHIFTPYLNHPLGIGILLLIQLYTDIIAHQQAENVDKIPEDTV